MKMPRRTNRWSAALCALLAQAACVDLALEPAQVPSRMEITPADTLITEGDPAKLTVTVFDSDQNSLGSPPTWAPPEWDISDPNSISIDADGSVTALAGGDLRLIARVAGIEASSRMRVNPANIRLTASAIYLNQAVQNVAGTVPILAGRDALLRVFATGDETSFYTPQVTARFYQGGQVVHSVIMDLGSDVLPAEIVEGRLDRSFNALIPGHVIQPGLGLVVELDPEGVVPLDTGSQTRIPESGVMEFDVVRMPLHIQTIVPTLLALSPDERIFNWTRGLDADSRQMEFARAVLPIGDMEVRVRETYTSTSDLTTESGWQRYLREMRVLWFTDGEVGYTYGVVRLPQGSAWGGLGYVGFPVSVGRDTDDTFTHELGHNMNLRHAPCGGAGGPDPNYPYDDGSTGVWGYSHVRSRLVDPDDYKDVMGYCRPDWISDYHFMRAYDHRVATEGLASEGPAAPSATSAEPVAAPAAGPTLLLWGAAGHAELLLEPAFLMDGPARLPAAPGPYRLEGIGADGNVVFAFDFTPDPVEFGGAHFLFAVPYDRARDGALDRVVLSGPAGEFRLGPASTPPMAIVTDGATGRISAILRDWNGGLNLVAPGSEVMVSDGLPGGVR